MVLFTFRAGGPSPQPLSPSRGEGRKRTSTDLAHLPPDQVGAVRTSFAALPAGTLRVLVTHHPFLPAPDERKWIPMARGEEALAALGHGALDLMLSGHQHRAYSAEVQRHYERASRALLVAHAGTSISTRLRGERLESPDIRAGIAMLIAALCAEGRSTIGDIGQIDRGYERIDERLGALGASIERVDL